EARFRCVARRFRRHEPSQLATCWGAYDRAEGYLTRGGYHHPKPHIGVGDMRAEHAATGAAHVLRSKGERAAPHHPANRVGRLLVFASIGRHVRVRKIWLPFLRSPKAARPLPDIACHVLNAPQTYATWKATHGARLSDLGCLIVRLVWAWCWIRPGVDAA